MVKLLSLGFAVLFDFIFRDVLLPAEPSNGILIRMSNFLMLIAVCMHLRRANFLPEHHQNASKSLYILVETVLVMIVLEFSVNVVWARVQISIECFMKFVLMDDQLHLFKEMGGDNLIGFIIACFTVYFLYYSVEITDNFDTIGLIVKDLVKKYNNDLFCDPNVQSPVNKRIKQEVPKKQGSGYRLIKPAAH